MNILKYFSQIRDGILICISFVYVLGYLVWTYFSFKFNNAPLPILEPQYFIAGFPIFLLLVIAYFLRKILLKLFINVPQLLHRLNLKYQIIIPLIFFILQSLFTVIMIYFVFFSDSSNRLYIVLILAIVSSFFSVVRSEFPDFKLYIHNFINFYLALILIIISLSQVYVMEVFPNIPQNLGGAKPRKALLDIDSKKLSYDTVNKLKLDITNSNNSIICTDTLTVVFLSSNQLYISYDNSLGTHTNLIELSRSLVSSIHWLDN